MNSQNSNHDFGGNITFGFLKPGLTTEQRLNILGMILSAGFTILLRPATLDETKLREHYAHHDGRSFFEPMIEYLTSGESLLMILQREDGVDAVQRLRDMAGPTDPKAGKPGQIRRDFGLLDSDVIFKNAIHCSGTPEEAAAEIARFFPGWQHP